MDFRALPSVDRFLSSADGRALVDAHGRALVAAVVRAELEVARLAIRKGEDGETLAAGLAACVANRLDADALPGMRGVLNLSGTVLHTNLGRAVLAEEAIRAAVEAMRQPVALEYDLDGGERGERDDHLRDLLCELT